MKACVDCKFHDSADGCHHGGIVDPVSGSVRHPYPEPCAHMRSESWAGRLCGPTAKFFEARVEVSGEREHG